MLVHPSQVQAPYWLSWALYCTATCQSFSDTRLVPTAPPQPNAGTLLAVMGILFYTHTLVFFTNEGFSAAAATRCSNLLGAGAAGQVRTVWVVWASRMQMINICVGLGGKWRSLVTRKASED